MKFTEKVKRFFTLSAKHEGFTLVELIVVIAILAILAGVAVPAYSGYIKKANRAGDATLLRAVNEAYAAACSKNGTDISIVQGADIDLVGESGAKKVDMNSIAPAELKSDFALFFEGNVDSEFKVFENIVYDNSKGMFVEMSDTYAALYDTLRATYANQLTTLINSNLGAIGVETLLKETASALEWANEIDITSMAGDAYWNAVKSYLGLEDLDLSEVPAESRYDAVALALMNNGMSEEAAGAMLTNVPALYVAQNSASVTTDSLSKWLGGDTTTDDLKAEANANTLAEAAAIYGLYMAYAESNNVEFDNKDGNVLEVMGAALSDKDGFGAWVNTDAGKAELDAYKASMEIINGAAGNEDVKNSVLTNGLDNSELIAMMESLMGK